MSAKTTCRDCSEEAHNSALKSFGVVIVFATIDSIFNGKVEMSSEIAIPFLSMLAFSFVFFGLAWVCGYMIKRCFD